VVVCVRPRPGLHLYDDDPPRFGPNIGTSQGYALLQAWYSSLLLRAPLILFGLVRRRCADQRSHPQGLIVVLTR